MSKAVKVKQKLGNWDISLKKEGDDEIILILTDDKNGISIILSNQKDTITLKDSEGHERTMSHTMLLALIESARFAPTYQSPSTVVADTSGDSSSRGYYNSCNWL